MRTHTQMLFYKESDFASGLWEYSQCWKLLEENKDA